MTSQLALRHRSSGVATVSECAIPEPAKDEVVVKVAAVCLNPIDWKILYGSKSSAPTTLGCDLAGTVASIGDGVTAVEVGDRVIGFTAGGKSIISLPFYSIYLTLMSLILSLFIENNADKTTCIKATL